MPIIRKDFNDAPDYNPHYLIGVSVHLDLFPIKL